MAFISFSGLAAFHEPYARWLDRVFPWTRGQIVEELMRSNPGAYGFQKAGDNLVLTGSTEELQKLVLELNKADVWDESECVRK